MFPSGKNDQNTNTWMKMKRADLDLPVMLCSCFDSACDSDLGWDSLLLVGIVRYLQMLMYCICLIRLLGFVVGLEVGPPRDC